MTEKTVTIGSNVDSRQAALFVQTTSKFLSCIHVMIGDKRINAKSIMGVIALSMTEGQSAIISAEGVDEDDAVSELAKILA